jgi:hypothetical protein
MKKKGVKSFLLATLFSIIISTTIISAQTTSDSAFIQGFEKAWNGVIDFITVILAPIFGTQSATNLAPGEVLFIKLLFFTILFLFVWSVAEQISLFSERKWAAVLVAIAVSVLATRFLAAPGWIETIMLPYGALGITISAIIPLIIYFYFVQATVENPTMRKISWIFASVVFMILYFMRAEEIGQIAGGGFNPANIYLITAIACIAFLLFDKTIQKTMERVRAENQNQLQQAQDQLALMRKINDIQKDLANGVLQTDTPHYKTIYNHLRDRARALGVEVRVTGGLPQPT